MDENFCCCTECFGRIAKIHVGAAKAWLDICSLHLKYNDVLVLRTNDFEELSMLEKLGYIITTEIPNHILVKVLGSELDEDGEWIYCINRRQHAGQG